MSAIFPDEDHRLGVTKSQIIEEYTRFYVFMLDHIMR